MISYTMGDLDHSNNPLCHWAADQLRKQHAVIEQLQQAVEEKDAAISRLHDEVNGLQAVLTAARAFVEHVPASNLNWEQFAEYVQQHKALEAGLVTAVKAAEGGE